MSDIICVATLGAPLGAFGTPGIPCCGFGVFGYPGVSWYDGTLAYPGMFGFGWTGYAVEGCVVEEAPSPGRAVT
jgi:hypothetical protein